MLGNTLLAGLAFIAAIIGWNAYTLFGYYSKAKSTGLPTIIHYVANGAPLWMMCAPLVIGLAEYLPFTSTFIETYRRGWEARVRSHPHLTHDIFILVTPRGNWVKVADSKVAMDILKRKDEFGRDMEAFKVLDIYGKSLATAEGEEWNRHRKVSAATFTEKNNELVWRESLEQANEMLRFWVDRSPQPIRTIGDDVKTFTLNVLSGALFGKRYPFEGRVESKRKDTDGRKNAAFRYRNSISTILEKIVPILIFGEKILREAWWLPESFRKAGHAVSNFRTHVNDLITEEELSGAGHAEKTSSPTLVTNLVKASQAGPKPLTRDEITSNLFVYAFAGNDTTAITFTHILAFMAASPEIQDWIAEEIRYFTDPSADAIDLQYETCAKLKRCLAVVYETLRICHPLSQLVKTTGPYPRTIEYDGRIVTIPAHTTVEINLSGLHTLPKHWGDDALSWDPHRFISGEELGNEQLAKENDFFYPWSFGKLACPGKRFSQVELVAVLSVLFRDHCLVPTRINEKESMNEARVRVGALARDTEMRLLSEMRQPHKLAVTWVSRL
ncbi:cytochrome P450 [Polyplosphaeria fusca]|uniref:Cytochrome P450 n=1 Tax=Polyplosphaeria fusca TaxID=682080 RepID=A0A9P4V879_9PLEO|nr:cytochrome P450 [Polyplosphaeria fusca]